MLTESEELCDYAWLILGVEAIALHFAQEEICRVEHCRVHRALSGIRRHGVLKKINSDLAPFAGALRSCKWCGFQRRFAPLKPTC